MLADIFGAEQHLAVLLDQRGHQIVDRLEVLGLGCRVPIGELQDVVAGSRLSLGRGGQRQLVALTGDEVDGEIDFLPLSPFAAQLRERLVGARDPMVPEPTGQLTGGVSAMNEWHAPPARHSRCGFQ